MIRDAELIQELMKSNRDERSYIPQYSDLFPGEDNWRSLDEQHRIMEYYLKHDGEIPKAIDEEAVLTDYLISFLNGSDNGYGDWLEEE